MNILQIFSNRPLVKYESIEIKRQKQKKIEKKKE